MTRKLLIAIHDVWPGTQDRCEPLLACLEKKGWGHVALMVIPRFQNQFSLENPEHLGFVNWLRDCEARGHEIWAHGLTHSALDHAVPASWWTPRHWVNRYFTQGESEFLGLSLHEKKQRLTESLLLFSRHHLKVSGFTPPTWWGSLPPQDLKLASDGVIRFQDLRFGIQDVERRKTKWIPAVVWPASRQPKRVIGGSLYIQCLRAFPVVRFALHPDDPRHPDFWKTLDAVGKNRSLIRTRDLFYSQSIEGHIAPKPTSSIHPIAQTVSAFDQWPTQPM